jgi:hypothetical protein
MKGLKVQCPGCKKVFHETTEKYDPDVRPNGAMVRLLEPWKGWGWAAFDAEGEAVSTTLCSEMICPGCQAQLAPSGRLTVIITPEDAQKIQPLNSFSDDGSKIKIPMEESAPPPFDQMPPDSTKQEESPLQEDAKLNDQVDAKVTHTEEPSTMECVKCHKVKHVNDFATPDECIECFEGVPVPAPKQKTKKKANTLKKKAKKRK